VLVNDDSCTNCSIVAGSCDNVRRCPLLAEEKGMSKGNRGAMNTRDFGFYMCIGGGRRQQGE
jgi:hypothetical protein